MPSAASSFAGPMPLRIRNTGECSAPIDTTISRAVMSIVSPSRRTRTPVTRVPSNSSRSARVRLRIDRLRRCRTSRVRYAMAVETR